MGSWNERGKQAELHGGIENASPPERQRNRQARQFVFVMAIQDQAAATRDRAQLTFLQAGTPALINTPLQRGESAADRENRFNGLSRRPKPLKRFRPGPRLTPR
jgi:hypothetical protein